MEAVEEVQLVGSPEQSVASPPLVVDLDGTLVKTDLLLESLLALLKRGPHYLFVLPLWLLKGKAYLKQQIARRVALDPGILPYRDEFLDYLKTERVKGRSIVLATASDVEYAHQLADHLALFDLVLASDGIANLSGETKRNRLVSEFGEKGFDYAGNDRHDLAVWGSARKAIAVNPGAQLSSNVARLAQVERVFQDPRKGIAAYLAPLRPQHWLKNLLVFVPLFAAHRFTDAALLGQALLAFLAFGCFASSGYLINDLLDLSADRRHPRKQLRAFASGELPLPYGLVMIPVLVGLGCILAMLASAAVLGIAAAYFALTVTYSLYVKKIVLLDVIVLAGLYNMRILAGSAAVDVWPSQWLLAFATFLFFSLALAKRYGELAANHVSARGYEPNDEELLASMGIASGYLAILVLALYINSTTAHILYARPGLIWLLCPLLLYWISHIWLAAHRGRMHDDPLVFATSDRVSRRLILVMLTIGVLAL
jgi:4-hydroxybenzoate polyprenyltransferase/phosphoserine phosphatase